jgi:dTDP-4-dehydrorhamnose 3,5-epimerase-like enzyme
MKIKKIISNHGILNILQNFPFKIKRLYYLNSLKKNNIRFGHAHKKLEQIYICLQGSFKITLINKKKIKKIIYLNKNMNILKISKMMWRRIKVTSNRSVLLVLASEKFDEKDYIRKFQDFINS